MKIGANHKIIQIIILFAIGLTPLLWFQGDFLIDGADLDYPLRPVKEFSYRTQAWDEISQGGRNNAINFPTLIFTGVRSGFYSITGGSLVWSEKLSFIFWFLFSILSIYALMDLLILKGRPFLVKLLPCLFYQFNFYQLVCWSEVHISGVTALAVLPVLFLVFVKVITGENISKNIIYFCVFSIFSGGIWVNPPTAVVFAFVFFSYFIVYILGLMKDKNWNLIPAVLGRGAVLGVCYIFLNSYILIPLIDTFFVTNRTGNPIEGFNVYNTLQFSCAYSNPLNVLRLMGRADLFANWKESEYYYPFFQKYLFKRSMMVGTFILPVLAFLGVILNRKNKFARFFCGLSILGIILSMGTHFPMKETYWWLIKHIPLFYLFRQPWIKFGLLSVFGFTVLAGLCCDKLYSYLSNLSGIITRKKVKGLLPGIFAVGLIGVYLFFMHAFIFGEMFTRADERSDLNPMHIKIPGYAYEAADWINKKEGDFTVLPLPEEKASFYRWGYRGITDILVKLLDKKILYQQWGEMGEGEKLSKMYNLFARALYKELTYNLDYYLNLIGARYIIQRNDLKYDFYGQRESPLYIRERIGKQNDIQLDTTFEEWDIYRNNIWKDDFISMADPLIWVSGSIYSLIPISELKYGRDVFSKDSAFLVYNKDAFPKEYAKDICLYIAGNPRDGKKSNGLFDKLKIPKGFLFYSDDYEKDVVGFWKRRIWIPEGGLYNIYTRLKTNFKDLITEGSEKDVFEPEDIQQWDFKANNVEYDCEIEHDSLIINCAFDGYWDEDEYVQVRTEDVNIDLEKYPVFVFDYKVQHPNIQTIEILLGLDFNDDGEVDDYFRGIKTTYSLALFNSLRVNLLQEVQYRFPKETQCKVVLIEFYAHKLWGMDCSQSDTEGNYGFFIKNIKFITQEEKKVAEVFDYNVNLKKKDIEVEVIEQTDDTMRIFIPLPDVSPVLFPEIEFKYRFKYPAGVDDSALFLHVRSRSGTQEDDVLFTCKTPINHKYAGYRIDVLKHKNDQGFFKDKVYSGLELRIAGERMREDINDILSVRTLKVFKSFYVTKWQRIKEKEAVYKINGKGIEIPYIEEEGQMPDDIIFHHQLSLDKGWNEIDMLLDENDFLQCSWIGIIPEYDMKSDILSEVKYQKLSETFYNVKIENIQNNFTLVMKNNYDPKWRLFLKKKVNNAVRMIEIKKHFTADGFANAWLIEGLDGDCEMIIKYYPQDLFRKGLMATVGFILMLLVVYIIRNLIIYFKISANNKGSKVS